MLELPTDFSSVSLPLAIQLRMVFSDTPQTSAAWRAERYAAIRASLAEWSAPRLTVLGHVLGTKRAPLAGRGGGLASVRAREAPPLQVRGLLVHRFPRGEAPTMLLWFVKGQRV